MAPTQMDPPRMINDKPYRKVKVCFEASINSVGKLEIRGTSNCNKGQLSVCGYDNADGNHVKRSPKVFTPHYPVDGVMSLYEIKDMLQRQQKKDYICNNPSQVECSAQERKGGRWVTNKDQQSNTLSCDKNRIVCREGKELDCSTFNVRFLCPQEIDICKELNRLNVNPCDKVQRCYRAENHFVCRNPPQYVFLTNPSPKVVRTGKSCGKCVAYGDPHYTTFAGRKYDFMGMGKFLFTGLIDKYAHTKEPHFAVYTNNVKCHAEIRPDGACVDSIEIRLYNIRPKNGGAPRNHILRMHGKAAHFTLNTAIVNARNRQQYFHLGILANVRTKFFELFVPSVKLWIGYFHGHELNVKILTDHFKGKLTGLCGDCGTNPFRKRDGSLVSVRNMAHTHLIAPIAAEWLAPHHGVLGRIPVTSIQTGPGSCHKEALEKLASTTKICDVFKTNKALNHCFQVTGYSRKEFYQACLYDVCEMGIKSDAVCHVVERFADMCAAKGIRVNWRRHNFCPMRCDADKEYRVDASCQPQCDRVPGSQGTCDERPVEGCVCKHGLYRLDNRCVPRDQCGCRVVDDDGNFVKFLLAGQSTLLPNCRKEAYCSKNGGSLRLYTKNFEMPSHKVCSEDSPPTLKCAHNYKLERSVCIKNFKEIECGKRYTAEHDVCVAKYPDPKYKDTWKQATRECRYDDGTLPTVDSKEKIENLRKIMEKYGFGNMYVAGRVVAYNMFGDVKFEQMYNDARKGSSRYINDHFPAFLLDELNLSSSIKPCQLPRRGRELGVIAYRYKEKIEFVAVPLKRKGRYMCEQLDY